MPPLGLVKAVVIQHADKLPDHWERGLKLDDRGHRNQDLDQQGTHCVLNLIPAAFKQKCSTLLKGSQGEGGVREGE